MFRLGTLHEKGLGVKKDVDVARRYYMQAAERGNAKAMHNLAVLDADGGGKGANYKSAAQWFRKAADRGVADSQFNLGILMPEASGSNKNSPNPTNGSAWPRRRATSIRHTSATNREAARRPVARPAKLAIQTFTVEPQPDDAVNVAGPGRRLGQRADAGEYGQARSKAGFEQARRPLIRLFLHRKR